MDTEQQKQLIAYAQEKVRAFFDEYPVTAHGHDHVVRVTEHIRKIAIGESARSPFLCELAALFHDIGRVPEHYEKKGPSHHELSYELLRDWFRNDRTFDVLNHEEKIELLYAVRYHWNDAADDCDTAILLRDADKLDAFGEIGLRRAKEWFVGEGELDRGFRYLLQMYFDIRTDTARRIMEEGKLLDPILACREQLFKSKIMPIEL